MRGKWLDILGFRETGAWYRRKKWFKHIFMDLVIGYMLIIGLQIRIAGLESITI